MRPSQQGFAAVNSIITEILEWLKDKMKFLSLDCVTKILPKCSPVAHLGIAFLVKNLDYFARAALGFIKCKIGIFQKYGKLASIGWSNCNSDRNRGLNLRIVDLKWDINSSNYSLSYCQRFIRVAHIGSNQCELVTAETRNAISTALVRL